MRRTMILNVTLGTALAGIAVGGYVVTDSSSEATVTETVSTAELGIVLSSVTATGNVEAPEELGVDFQQSGQVLSIAVVPGQRVEAGAELARVEDVEQQTALGSARDQLASAEAKLAAARRGPTTQERSQNAATARQSLASVTNAEEAADRTRRTAETNAVKLQLQVDQAAQQVAAATATAAENVDRYQLQVDQALAQLSTAESKVDDAVEVRDDVRAALVSLQASYDPGASGSEATNQLINRYRLDQADCQAHSGDPGYSPPDGVTCSQLSNLLTFAQNLQTAETSLTQATDGVATAGRSLDTARQTQASGLLSDQQQIASAQRSLDTARQNQAAGLLADQQQVASSEASLRTAQRAYESTLASNAVKEAPATPEDLAQAQASVASARVQVDTAERNVEDTVLRAPVAGTVASISGRVGEDASGSGGGSGGSGGSTTGGTTSSGTSTDSTSSETSGFVVLTNLDLLDVRVGFTETDAAKVRVGQQASIELDALPGSTHTGTVISIDVTSTVANNVVTYYAKVAFDERPDGVRPGMTAAVSVVLDKREDVVVLPTSSVPTSGSTATVTVREGGVDATRTINLGLRGDQGVEVTGGLDAGDEVIVESGGATGGIPGGFTPPGGGGGGLGGGLGGGG